MTDWKYEIGKAKQKVLLKIVWKLPRTLVMWCAIRVIANATTGDHRNQVVPELLAMDALDRWDIDQTQRAS